MFIYSEFCSLYVNIWKYSGTLNTLSGAVDDVCIGLEKLITPRIKYSF